MRLSRKSEYALLALLELAQNYNQGPMPIGQVAANRDIPKKYLEQILLQMKGAALVRSIKGVNGGYVLARKPDEINLAQVVRLMDGALASIPSASQYFYEQSPIESHQKLWQVFKDIRDYVAVKMENTTLQDLL